RLSQARFWMRPRMNTTSAAIATIRKAQRVQECRTRAMTITVSTDAIPLLIQIIGSSPHQARPAQTRDSVFDVRGSASVRLHHVPASAGALFVRRSGRPAARAEGPAPQSAAVHQ